MLILEVLHIQLYLHFCFAKNVDFISLDQHNHLDDAMIFNIKRILYFLHVSEALKISELSSWNILATSLAVTLSSPLIYF